MLFLSEWLPVDFQNHMDGSNNDRISKKKKKKSTSKNSVQS